MWAYNPATKFTAEAFSMWIAHCELLLSGAFNWITPIWKGFSLRTFMYSFHHQYLARDRKYKEEKVVAEERLKYQGATVSIRPPEILRWSTEEFFFLLQSQCIFEWGKGKENRRCFCHCSFLLVHFISFLCSHFPTLTSCLVGIKPCDQF